MRKDVKDISNQRFGRLVAIELAGSNKRGAVWKCKCDCGNYVNVNSHSLLGNNTKSCGCLAKEVKSNLFKGNKYGTVHNGSHERLYTVWSKMKQRCMNPNNKHYHNYGGRGIKVCDEWMDYSTFREWALKTGYDPYAKTHECTLERIDVNGDYCPSNCTWADSTVQAHNRRNNVWLEYNGEVKTQHDWAKQYGMCSGTLSHRLKAGWTLEEALTTPVKKKAQ